MSFLSSLYRIFFFSKAAHISKTKPCQMQKWHKEADVTKHQQKRLNGQAQNKFTTETILIKSFEDIPFTPENKQRRIPKTQFSPTHPYPHAFWHKARSSSPRTLCSFVCCCWLVLTVLLAVTCLVSLRSVSVCLVAISSSLRYASSGDVWRVITASKKS